MRDFRELVVWQKSHALTLEVYRMTKRFPREEIHGLTSQIRRAASSVPANIVEGNARRTDVEMARFLHIALGSASELEYHLLLARDLESIAETNHSPLNQFTNEVKRMIITFIRKLKSTS
jgi:four helix bundle protein